VDHIASTLVSIVEAMLNSHRPKLILVLDQKLILVLLG
jgi:hypothetical protein